MTSDLFRKLLVAGAAVAALSVAACNKPADKTAEAPAEATPPAAAEAPASAAMEAPASSAMAPAPAPK